TILRTADSVEGQLSAAFTNEFLAVSWAEKSATGLRRMVSFLDIEQLRVPEPKDLGADSGNAARVQPLAKRFAVVWTSSEGLMSASFDSFGKATTPTKKLAWSGQPSALAVVQCAERTWVVREAGKELTLASGEASGAMKELARLPMSPDKEFLPLSCVDDA